jgi:superfamily II DNA or RNA helicase
LNKLKNNLKLISFKKTYDSYEDFPIDDFFVPSLNSSNLYQRAVGYFSSAILSVIPEAFTNFAERGGKIELICSPILSFNDANILENINENNYLNDLNNSLNMIENDGLLKQPLDLLSALIKTGCLTIKFAIPYDTTSGIFHQKIGVFKDVEDNFVSFSGSNNESVSGWMELKNSESFSVYCSWRDLNDYERAEEIQLKFDRMWRNNYRGFDILDFTESLDFIQRRSTEDTDIAKLKSNVREWYQDRKKSRNLSNQFQLFPYQKEVISDWKQNNNRGIVCFATGAGKTITAISAIIDWRKGIDKRTILILVPSVRLQKQWLKEIRKFEDFKKFDILLAGGISKSENWQPGLRDITSFKRHENDGIVIAVMDTASKESFIDRVSWGNHLLVVADEVHNLGASSFHKLLSEINVGGILGLSATPNRYNDDENELVRKVFDRDLKPIVDIPYAQELGVLVQYRYRFETVQLSEDELESYKKLTKLIGMKSQGNKELNSKELNLLIYQRANILKNAEAKTNIAESLIRREFIEGNSWIIFCNDKDQLENLREKIRDYSPLSYYQEMEGDPDQTLKLFEREGGILLAIQMMDEGVDIPSIDRCLILASSQNTRQYIQRRGRVLRVNRETPKGVAEIWDILVIDSNGKSFNDAEIVRAMEFARMAINHSIVHDLSKISQSDVSNTI